MSGCIEKNNLLNNRSPQIFIILPTFNRSNITNIFADCLLEQKFKNYHLILVDDGSTDDTVKSIKKKIKNITVIMGDGNLWWAGAVQQGINWLRRHIKDLSKVVLIANDDISFDENYLENAMRIINEKNINLVSRYENSKRINPFFCFNDDNGKFILESQKNYNPNCFAMNAVFFKLSFLMDIGNFHVRLLPHYLADIEFSYRAIKKGHKFIQDESVKVKWNIESTGIHEIENLKFFKFVKVVFSKKYSSNPISWTFFYFYTVKKRCVLIVITYYWLKFTIKFAYKFLISVLKYLFLKNKN